ncbi:MAG: hypothetical protein ACREDD_05150 [Methylocella sp.]
MEWASKIDVEKHRESWAAIFTSAQLALRFCNFDHIEAEAAVRRALDAGDDDQLDIMSANWEDDVKRLEALIAIMKEARMRAAVSKNRLMRFESVIWRFDVSEYTALKAQNPGAILFYRMGDFYELLFDDAGIAARALGVVLTKRAGHEPIPLCRVPVARAEDYLNRLVCQGRSVAVCELIRNLDGSYRREVFRVAKPRV